MSTARRSGSPWSWPRQSYERGAGARAQRHHRHPQPPRAAAALPRVAVGTDPGSGDVRGDRRRRRLRRRQRRDGRSAQPPLSVSGSRAAEAGPLRDPERGDRDRRGGDVPAARRRRDRLAGAGRRPPRGPPRDPGGDRDRGDHPEASLGSRLVRPHPCALLERPLRGVRLPRGPLDRLLRGEPIDAPVGARRGRWRLDRGPKGQRPGLGVPPLPGRLRADIRAACAGRPRRPEAAAAHARRRRARGRPAPGALPPAPGESRGAARLVGPRGLQGAAAPPAPDRPPRTPRLARPRATARAWARTRTALVLDRQEVRLLARRAAQRQSPHLGAGDPQPRDRSDRRAPSVTAAPDFGLSVVIATHKRRELLRRCLESLSAQTQDPATFEVIVADDGSSDGSAEMAEAFGAPYRLRVLRLPKGGKSAALNAAIEQAAGLACLFIDDDVIASPALVAEHAAAHREEPKVLAIGKLTQPPPESGDWFAIAHAEAWNERYETLAGKRVDWPDTYGGNFSAPREPLLAAGGFDAELPAVEDIELGSRLCEAGCRVRYLPGAEGVHDDEEKPRRKVLADVRGFGGFWAEFSARWPAARGRLLGPGLDPTPRADVRGFGGFCAEFSARWPAARAKLLGWFLDTTPREVMLRRLFLTLRLPPRMLAMLGAAIPGQGRKGVWFGFVSRYALWLGRPPAVRRRGR